MEQQDPRVARWDNIKNLRCIFQSMLEAAAANNEEKMDEFTNLQLPRFMLPILPACMHLMRSLMKELDALSNEPGDTWTRYFVPTSGGSIPLFSAADFKECSKALKKKKIQIKQIEEGDESEDQEQEIDGRLTPEFCLQKISQRLSFPEIIEGQKSQGGGPVQHTASSGGNLLEKKGQKSNRFQSIQNPFPFQKDIKLDQVTRLNRKQMDSESEDEQDKIEKEEFIDIQKEEEEQGKETIIQRIEKLPKFQCGKREEDALKSLIEFRPSIHRPEDVISVAIKSHSYQINEQDRSLALLGKRVFNQIRLGLATMKSGEFEIGTELMTLKGMEIYAEIERTWEKALGIKTAQIATEQGRERFKYINESIQEQQRSKYQDFGSWQNSSQQTYYQRPSAFQQYIPFNQWAPTLGGFN
ncbi:MAG: hypothetical protein EZS28_025608 [Streblomastix strix]|uniref:Uncharacterized protein n=1 Tax=Streblomastix strix TaxID=222440 RepID=A0A5J4V8M7_9EUKA|nr:MAG: hypothetical protein EZS28_025608 [Streblomastix strix]